MQPRPSVYLTRVLWLGAVSHTQHGVQGRARVRREQCHRMGPGPVQGAMEIAQGALPALGLNAPPHSHRVLPITTAVHAWFADGGEGGSTGSRCRRGEIGSGGGGGQQQQG